MDKLRLYLSELIGTFVLVFIGVGSVGGTHMGHDHPLELLPIALAFGLAVAVMVASIGHISGCHINPAVTVALLVTGKIKFADAIAYVVAQLAGATLGAAALAALFNVDPGIHAINPAANAATIGATGLNGDLGVTIGQGLGIEFVLTFILVFAIFGTAVDMRAQKIPSLFIGLIVASNILVGGIYTGASMNPARTFGPALIGHVWANHWIYWVGPIAGGIAAGLVYSLLFLPRTAAEAAPEVRPDAAK